MQSTEELATTVDGWVKEYGSDWKSWLIGAGACGLGLNKRINILVILGLAGLVGYLIYHV